MVKIVTWRFNTLSSITPLAGNIILLDSSMYNALVNDKTNHSVLENCQSLSDKTGKFFVLQKISVCLTDVLQPFAKVKFW